MTTRSCLSAFIFLFLGVFLLAPLGGLLLAAFLGEQVPLLRWVLLLDVKDAVHRLNSQGTLLYFQEFFVTPRYYRGLFNSVGTAPPVMLGLFLVSLLGERVWPARAGTWRWLRGPGELWLLGALVVWAATLPLWSPADSVFRIILNQESLPLRLLQLFGYCPLVTLVAALIGVGVAFSLHSSHMPFRKFFTLLVIVPLSLPPFLGALAFKNLLGDYGMVTRLFESVGLSHPFVAQSPLSAGLVESFLFFPFVTLTTLSALERFDSSFTEAARVLGGSRWYTFLTVTLPTLLPGILAGSFLVFVRCFGDFATLYLLLPTRYSMIVIEAYRDFVGSTNWGGASVLSLLMVMVILILLALQKYVVEGGGYRTVSGRGQTLPVSEGGQRHLIDWLALLFCCCVFLVPLAFLASTFLVSIALNWGAEIVPRQFTWNRYPLIFRALLTEYDSPLVNSFSLTGPALVGCILLSFFIAFLISRGRGKWTQAFDFITVLPFVIPGVAFALALIGVFNSEPFALHSTAYLVILAYIVTRAPYGVRTTLASFQQIGVSMEESSRTLGAPESLTLTRITVPLVSPGIFAGSVMVFISCMQDVAITLMIAPPDWAPTSVYVFQAIERGRIYEASAYGVVLFFLIVVPYSLIFFSKRFKVRAGL